MLLTYKINKSGQKSDPCGTPDTNGYCDAIHFLKIQLSGETER